MRKYADYAASPLRWNTELPAHWDIKRLKLILQERKENNMPVKTNDILSLTNTKGVIPYSQKGSLGNKSKENIEDYHLAYPNDLVLNSMNVIIGSVGVSKYFGAISPVYYALFPREDDNIRYFEYIFKLPAFEETLKGLGNGILEIRKRIPMIKLNSVLLPVPPRDEQDQIVRFLDWKVSAINRLIDLRRREIAGLEALKVRLITDAVTKGLNKDAPVKSSSSEWMGDIPAHWNIVKIKRLARLSKEKSQNSGLRYLGMENVLSWRGKYTLSESIVPESVVMNFHKGDILFGKLRPYLAKAVIADFDGVCSTEFLVLKDIKCKGEFMLYAMLNKKFIDYVDSSTYGTKMPRANWDFIGNVKIPVPPRDEQDRIVSYLEGKVMAADRVIASKRKEIKALQELNVALISDAVTGRIDVRGVEVPEFERVEEDLAGGGEAASETEEMGGQGA